jgi:hypothetical protein
MVEQKARRVKSQSLPVVVVVDRTWCDAARDLVENDNFKCHDVALQATSSVASYLAVFLQLKFGKQHHFAGNVHIYYNHFPLTAFASATMVSHSTHPATINANRTCHKRCTLWVFSVIGELISNLLSNSATTSPHVTRFIVHQLRLQHTSSASRL